MGELLAIHVAVRMKDRGGTRLSGVLVFVDAENEGSRVKDSFICQLRMAYLKTYFPSSLFLTDLGWEAGVGQGRGEGEADKTSKPYDHNPNKFGPPSKCVPYDVVCVSPEKLDR